LLIFDSSAAKMIKKCGQTFKCLQEFAKRDNTNTPK